MAKSDNIIETPLMKQYLSIKAKYPDALLLFRVGDFYETFSEDAIKTSQVLGIVLTKRANGAASYVDLAGFPYHSTFDDDSSMGISRPSLPIRIVS